MTDPTPEPETEPEPEPKPDAEAASDPKPDAESETEAASDAEPAEACTRDACPHPRRVLLCRLSVALLALVLSLTLTHSALTRADRLGYGSPDDSMFIQLCWNTISGNGPTFTQEAWEGPAERSYFASHLNLLYVFYLPLFALWPGHEILCWLKPALSMLGALPLYWLAARKLKSEGKAALISAIYLFQPLVAYNGVRLSSNYLTLPLLLFALERLDAGKRGVAGVCFVLAVFGREEIAFQVCAFLGVLAVFDREGRRSHLIVSAIALAYVLFYVGFLKGQFGVGPNHFARFSHLGDSLPAVALSPLLSPRAFWGHLFAGSALGLLFVVVFPLGPALLAPRYVLAALTPWALVAISGVESDRVLGPYMVPTVPFLCVGAIEGLAWASKREQVSRWPVVWIGLGLAALATLLAWKVDAGPMGRYRMVRALERAPLDILAQGNPEYPYALAMADSIPEDASVCASPTLFVHLACRRYLYPFPVRADEVDVILVDTRVDPRVAMFNPRWPPTAPEAHTAEVERLSKQPGAKVVQAGGFLLIDRRGVAGEKLGHR